MKFCVRPYKGYLIVNKLKVKDYDIFKYDSMRCKCVVKVHTLKEAKK